MSVATVATVTGLLIDAALGGATLLDAFARFRKGRDPKETQQEAAAVYVQEMLGLAIKERAALTATTKWLAKHGTAG